MATATNFGHDDIISIGFRVLGMYVVHVVHVYHHVCVQMMVKCRVYFRRAHTIVLHRARRSDETKRRKNKNGINWWSGARKGLRCIDHVTPKLMMLNGSKLHTHTYDTIWRLFLMSLIDPFFVRLSSIPLDSGSHEYIHGYVRICLWATTIRRWRQLWHFSHAIHLQIRLTSCACVCPRSVFPPTSNIT